MLPFPGGRRQSQRMKIVDPATGRKLKGRSFRCSRAWPEHLGVPLVGCQVQVGEKLVSVRTAVGRKAALRVLREGGHVWAGGAGFYLIPDGPPPSELADFVLPALGDAIRHRLSSLPNPPGLAWSAVDPAGLSLWVRVSSLWRGPRPRMADALAGDLGAGWKTIAAVALTSDQDLLADCCANLMAGRLHLVPPQAVEAALDSDNPRAHAAAAGCPVSKDRWGRLSELAASNPGVLAAAASNAYLPEEWKLDVVARYIGEGRPRRQMWLDSEVAALEFLPAWIMEELAGNKTTWVRLAANRSCPPSVAVRIARESDDPRALVNLAWNRSISSEAVRILWDRLHSESFDGVVDGGDGSADTGELLDAALESLPSHPNFPGDLTVKLLEDPPGWARPISHLALRCPNLPVDKMWEVVSTWDATRVPDLTLLALNPAAPAELLQRLLDRFQDDASTWRLIGAISSNQAITLPTVGHMLRRCADHDQKLSVLKRVLAASQPVRGYVKELHKRLAERFPGYRLDVLWRAAMNLPDPTDFSLLASLVLGERVAAGDLAPPGMEAWVLETPPALVAFYALAGRQHAQAA